MNKADKISYWNRSHIARCMHMVDRTHGNSLNSVQFVGGAPGPWPWYFFQNDKKGPGAFFEGPGTFLWEEI